VKKMFQSARARFSLLVSMAVFLSVFGMGCGKSRFVPDSDELANVAGDIAASLDESFLASGAASQAGSWFHVLHGSGGEEETELTGPELPSCLSVSPIPNLVCVSGVKTWSLNGQCSSGLRTGLDGVVQFLFSDPGPCGLSAEGDTVTRAVNYSLSGKKMGVMELTSSNQGQVLLKTSAGFQFTVNDLSRVLRWDHDGETSSIDFSTPAPWVVSGFDRQARVVNSGSLRARHAEFGWTAELQIVEPLAFAAGCNCPISGSLAGSITGDQTDPDFRVKFEECGVSRVIAEGGETLRVKLDRCAPDSSP